MTDAIADTCNNARTAAQDLTLGKSEPQATAWLVGGGEMGERIRALDWSKTPLGPPERWPQSLRSAVSILLPSKAQIVLFWGREYVSIYNDAYRPVFGGKHPKALGLPGKEAWSEIWSDVLRPLLDGVVMTGEAFWGKDLLFFLERHGYPEETYFDVSYDPVRDETGGVGGVFCIVSETTGRVLGERRLAALRDLGSIGNHAESLQDVFKNASAVLARYDKDIPFAALYRRMPGTNAAHFVAGSGLSEADSIDGVALDDCDRFWQRAVDGVVLTEFAADASRPNGPWAEPPHRVAIFKIATGGSEPFGYLATGLSSRRKFDGDYRDFLDLVCANIASALANAQSLEEERKRAAALAELDRAKTAFFSNVSHEFRTPLTLMLGPIEDLLATARDSEREALQVIHRNGQRLLRLVNTLLDFARIEAGRAQTQFKEIDLATFTADLASNFRSACERAGLALEVDCPPTAKSLADRDVWEKIVLNLLSNAFKFTFAGRISVRLREVAERFELTVSDTGVGIPADSLSRVFERFYRVEAVRGRSYEGSGIGLALVHELVKLHHGSISVQSELGRGTTFTVSIPRLPAGTQERTATERAAPKSLPASMHASSPINSYVTEAISWLANPGTSIGPAKARNSQRVLLADDNADLREYARKLLSEHYTVEAVTNGNAALAAARRSRPDLIVSDVMMPELDGFGLLQQVRADEALRTIPVILLSARAGEEARIEGLNAGADDYVVKPFSSRELLVRVGSLLKSADLHRREREALARFESLLNNAPLGVYLIDQDFRLAAVNPVALPFFGEIPNLIGRDFAEVIKLMWPAKEAEEIIGIFRRTLSTGEARVVPEWSERRLDRGVIEYYEWQVNRITLAGHSYGVVCYFREISKAVMAREALQEADSRKDEFLATLSHELRNPLAPLRSTLELLKLKGDSQPLPGRAVEIMDRQINHLVRLVDDLLEVSRITRGNVELRKEPMLLEAAINSAIETSEPAIRSGAHRLKVSMPPDSIVVDADAVRLSQVFGNLLNNAAKYSDAGGTISIEARRENEAAVVTVSDTGDGIPPEQLPQMFKIFSRGDGSAKRHQSGLGIGLALVRCLVELHGGRVEAHSDGPGRGSSFIVYLPLSKADRPLPAANGAIGGACAAVKILIVDDNRDAAESLRLLLMLLGAEVTVVQDGPAALEVFDSLRPRVVLLDIGMPLMDGYEVARRLRASPSGGHTLLVALTGWAQESDRLRAKEAGFDLHLVKPVELNAIQSLLTTIAANEPVADVGGREKKLESLNCEIASR